MTSVARRSYWTRPIALVVLTILTVAVPWRSGAESAGLFHVVLSDFVGILLIVVVGVIVLRSPPSQLMSSWIIWIAFAVVSAGVISTMTAVDGVASVSGLLRFTQVFVLLPIATWLAIQSESDATLILGSVVALGLVEGVIGIVQFVTGTGAQFGEVMVRATGTFGAFNLSTYSFVLTSALIGLAALIATRPQRRPTLVAIACLVAGGLIASFSRAGWLATAVGVVAIVNLFNWRKAILAVLAIALSFGVLGAFAPGPIAARVVDIRASISGADKSVVDRYALWETAWLMFREKPITGWGLKGFEIHADTYAPLQLSSGSDIMDESGGSRRVPFNSPHNLYLLILAEQGVVGGLAYLLFFGGVFLAGWTVFRSDRDKALARPARVFAFGWLIAFLALSLVGDTVGPAMSMVGVLLGVAVWHAVESQHRPNGPGAVIRDRHSGPAGA